MANQGSASVNGVALQTLSRMPTMYRFRTLGDFGFWRVADQAVCRVHGGSGTGVYVFFSRGTSGAGIGWSLPGTEAEEESPVREAGTNAAGRSGAWEVPRPNESSGKLDCG